MCIGLLTMAKRQWQHSALNAHLTALSSHRLPLLGTVGLWEQLWRCCFCPRRYPPLPRTTVIHEPRNHYMCSLALNSYAIDANSRAGSLALFRYAHLCTWYCILNAGPAQKRPPAPIRFFNFDLQGSFKVHYVHTTHTRTQANNAQRRWRWRWRRQRALRVSSAPESSNWRSSTENNSVTNVSQQRTRAADKNKTAETKANGIWEKKQRKLN